MISLSFKAILFDLDGTLVDSWTSIEYAWTTWCLQNQLEYNDLVKRFNGSRAVDIIKTLTPHLDAENEKLKLDKFEIKHQQKLKPIPGAQKLLHALPTHCWGIVTSGSHAVASHKLKKANIEAPATFITSEKISQGKPHPEGYLRAASLLAVEPQHCLVFEDSPQGVEAALNAGMSVIALTTTFPENLLVKAHARIANYESLKLTVADDAMTIATMTPITQ